jgi:hypothetical protein
MISEVAVHGHLTVLILDCNEAEHHGGEAKLIPSLWLGEKTKREEGSRDTIYQSRTHPPH